MVITDTLYFVDEKCFMLFMQIKMLFVKKENVLKYKYGPVLL